jgi:hypothetical protein
MLAGSSMERGVLTIAHGKKEYIELAKFLALSLELHNPGIKKAIVTDSTDQELRSLFDVVVPVNPDYGKGFLQKLHICDYTPFEETMFIDADCLCSGNIDFLWELFKGHDVSVIGRQVTEGSLFGFSMEDIRKALPLQYVIAFNGGIYYFRKNETARAVFASANDLKDKYNSLRLVTVRGEVADEPLMSLAMGLHHQVPVNDSGKGMYTPVGQTGQFKMDVLKGFCQFEKEGRNVKPAIMHFGFGYTRAFHYRREKWKLKLHCYAHLPKVLASAMVNVFSNPVYMIYVFIYRIMKSVFKGVKFKMSPTMPMFRFE